MKIVVAARGGLAARARATMEQLFKEVSIKKVRSNAALQQAGSSAHRMLSC